MALQFSSNAIYLMIVKILYRRGGRPRPPAARSAVCPAFPWGKVSPKATDEGLVGGAVRRNENLKMKNCGTASPRLDFLILLYGLWVPMWAGGLPVGRGLACGPGACPRHGSRILHNAKYLAYCKTSFRRERCPQRSAAQSAVCLSTILHFCKNPMPASGTSWAPTPTNTPFLRRNHIALLQNPNCHFCGASRTTLPTNKPVFPAKPPVGRGLASGMAVGFC